MEHYLLTVICMQFENLQLYQVVILIIAGAMIYQGLSNFFKGKDHQTLLKIGVRIVVWGGMAAIVVFPGLTNTLAQVIGIEGNLNAVILTGFILVFLIIFKLLSAIEYLEQQMTVLTRQDALKEISQKK